MRREVAHSAAGYKLHVDAAHKVDSSVCHSSGAGHFGLDLQDLSEVCTKFSPPRQSSGGWCIRLLP